MDESGLELTFALKHLDTHLQTNDANVKKLIKLQQRIVSKENLISCKGAVKIYQAYDALLQDIERSISTVDHILRFCGQEEEQTTTTPTPTPMQMQTSEEKHEPVQDDAVMVDASSQLSPPSATDNDFMVGRLVAALTLTAEGSEEWILARVCAIREGGAVFDVEDAEIEGEPEEKETYSVKSGNTIMIPESDDAALQRPEFKLRQSVLALYPGTTCFYSATVMSPPSRRRKTRDYLLKFADDDVPNRQCSPRFVLPFLKK